MRKWAQRIAIGAFTLALALIAQDRVFPGVEIKGGWSLTVWIILFVSLGVVVLTADATRPLLPTLSLKFRYSPPERRSKRKLRRKAERTSTAVHGLAAEFDATPHLYPASMIEQLNSTIQRYWAECSADALWCFDEFERRGMTGDVERVEFESPVNSIVLRRVAQQLSVWARNL